MLQDFRNNLRGITLVFLVGIIIVPFALFGVDSLFFTGSAVEEVASVDGEGISRLRLQQAIATRKQQLQDQLGNVDPALLDDELLRGPVLDALVRQKAVEQAAKDQGMAVASADIARLTRQTSVFQSEGKFDRERYDFVLRQMGYTPKTYRQLMETELAVSQFARGVLETAFATETELALTAKLSEQTRSFYYLTLPLSPILAEIKLEQAEIEKYYGNNQTSFTSPEQVVIEYIELKGDDLLDRVDVDPASVRQQYEAEVAALKGKEERQVAHILVEPQADNSQPKIIADIQQRIAQGEDFAALAREYSDDAGSAEQGGDLGIMVPGTFPEAFEKAANGLQEGEISSPVKTESGLHIIKLLALRKPEIPAFEQEKERIENQLRRQLAGEQLPAQVEALKEQSYNVETLQSVADNLALPLQVSKPFSRTSHEGIARYPQVVRAAFSTDVLENRFSSPVLELAQDHYAVLKIREHLPQAIKPLEQVRDEIANKLRRERGEALLAEKASALVARVKAGQSVEDVAKAENLQWQVALDTPRYGGNVDAEVRNQLFGIPVQRSLPVVNTFAKRSGDQVVYSLEKITPGDVQQLSKEKRSSLANSIQRMSADQQYRAYEAMVMADADIAIKQ